MEEIRNFDRTTGLRRVSGGEKDERRGPVETRIEIHETDKPGDKMGRRQSQSSLGVGEPRSG